MHIKNKISLTRKTLHGIMLLGLILSAFGPGNLPGAHAQAANGASTERFAKNNPALSPPSNDDFNTPIFINSLPYTNTQDTTTATTAPDDPIFTACGKLIQGSHSVWYRFTPSVDGTLNATTKTSNYDTMLALWKGVRGSLINVACNDDAPPGLQSQISAVVQVGVPYFLEVVSYGTTGGTLNLFVNNSCPGEPNSPLFTTRDNQNNAGSGVGDCDMDAYLYNNSLIQPIEFTINVPNTTITSAELLLLNWDVDEDTGEVDQVYFNNHSAGILVGVNEAWSTTTISINPAWVVTGDNLVRIDIDTTGLNRAVKTDWGQLVINDQGGTAFIRTVNLDKSAYTPGSGVQITVEVDTSLASQSLRTEINLRNSNGQILDGTSVNHIVTGASNDSVLVNLNVPAGAPQGTYNIQALVYDLASSKFQDSQVITFTVKNFTVWLPVIFR